MNSCKIFVHTQYRIVQYITKSVTIRTSKKIALHFEADDKKSRRKFITQYEVEMRTGNY